MSWIGKVVGAVIGYLIFRNLFGMVLGGMLGHFFDMGVLRARPVLGQSFVAPLPCLSRTALSQPTSTMLLPTASASSAFWLR